MDNEILNIDYHTCDLLTKALNRAPRIREASELFGMSERSVFRLIEKYDIKYNKSLSKYEAHKIPKYEILNTNSKWSRHTK